MVASSTLLVSRLSAASPAPVDDAPELGACGRHESTYSTSSAIVPPLNAKPLAGTGRWADEVEDAFDFEVDSHDFGEEYEACAAETEVGTPRPDDVTFAGPCDSVQQSTPEQPSSGRSHVSYTYRHDPYVGAVELFRCGCVDCQAAVPYANEAVLDNNALRMGPCDDGMGFYAEAPQQPEPRQSSNDYYYPEAPLPEAYRQVVDCAPPLQRPMNFVPTPPPPLATKRVLAEECNPNVETIYANLILRWYARVSEVQHQWLSGDNCCPDVNDFAEFDKWAAACADWWVLHFGEAQKRQPAAPTLRGQAAGARSTGSEAFQTHASSASRREPRQPLQPRRGGW